MSEIKDMIQWLPGQYSYWTPVNFSGVVAAGAEFSCTAEFKMFADRALKLRINYSLNSTRSQQNTNQLIYVPGNQVNTSLFATFGPVTLALNNNYTGRRYTNTDNSSSLPGYLLTGITAAYTRKFGSSVFTFNLRSENIFNARYEVIAYYPMPGRSFLFSVIYQFNKPL